MLQAPAMRAGANMLLVLCLEEAPLLDNSLDHCTDRQILTAHLFGVGPGDTSMPEAMPAA